MNTGDCGLKKLQNLVEPYLDKGTEIVGKQISQFSEPGENYGGILYKANLTLNRKSENGLPETEEISFIIKTIPQTEYFQILFNTQVSVKVEIAFYEVIVPTLEKFQEKYGVKSNDLFPKFYGGRLSLDETSDKVDRDSVIVLQNLQIKGKN